MNAILDKCFAEDGNRSLSDSRSETALTEFWTRMESQRSWYGVQTNARPSASLKGGDRRRSLVRKLDEIPKTALTLELLQLFALSAELRTITAAAQELKLSASLATRKLAQLEGLLGLRLFQRSTRRMVLTEGGLIALSWAKGVLASYDSLLDDLALLTNKPSGLIRFAANHFGAEHLLPQVLPEFSLRYPEIQVSVTTTDNMVDVIAGRYDVAVYSGVLPDSRLVGIRVAEFRRIVCAAPDYLERRGTPQHPGDLAQHDCLTHSTIEPINWSFRIGDRLVSQPVRPRVETDNNTVLLEMARNAVGIACLPDFMLLQDIAQRRLIALLTDYESVYSNGELPGLWIVYPDQRVLHRTRLFINFLHQTIKKVSAKRITFGAAMTARPGVNS